MRNERQDRIQGPEPSESYPRVFSLQPEGCVVADGAIVVSIHRAPIQGARVAEIRSSMERVAESGPAALVSLSAFRLSPEFPIGIGADANLHELASLLRFCDRTFVAIASIIEFGGVRGAAMRVATRAVRTLARPRAAMQEFDRVSDAVAWLRPHAASAGAPRDSAAYVKLYQYADQQLEELDVARGRASGSHLAAR